MSSSIIRRRTARAWPTPTPPTGSTRLQVKKEVTAAGFVFVGESDVLRNPADPRTALVFDKSIRGHTDQFAYKFRKPG